ncbi:uncharacterized protein LOC135399266 [Ornithodoros turicata]|uniref:uncharacterized protein LOC135399266 n=1 Tax=Ornithodoros turicata TaxID=34597 RepID=UPI0031391546
MAPARFTCVGFSPQLNWRIVEFVCPLPIYRICSVCSVVPDTIFSLECGHVFCQSCINDLTQSETLASCPFDNKSFDVRGISKDVSSEGFIMNSKVFCLNKDTGCSYTGPLSSMIEHYTGECSLHIVHCRSCKSEITRRDILPHVRGGCSRETVLSRNIVFSGASDGEFSMRNVSDTILSKIDSFEEKFLKTCDELKHILGQGEAGIPIQEPHVESTRARTPDTDLSTEAVSDQESPEVTERTCASSLSQESEDYQNSPLGAKKADTAVLREIPNNVETPPSSNLHGATAQNTPATSSALKPGTTKNSKNSESQKKPNEANHYGSATASCAVGVQAASKASDVIETSTASNALSPSKASKGTGTTPSKMPGLKSSSSSQTDMKPSATTQTAASPATSTVSTSSKSSSTPLLTAFVPSVFLMDPSLSDGAAGNSEPTGSTIFTWEVKPYWKLRNRPTPDEPCIFSSDPFFIGENGYKARLEGRFHEDDSEVFLGLYIHLQKGPNDAKLDWPFKKKCTFVLVHSKHEKRNLKFVLGEDLQENKSLSINFCRPKRVENDAVGIAKCVSAACMKQGGYVKNNTFKVHFVTCGP